MEKELVGLLRGLKIQEDHSYNCEKCRDTGYTVENGIAYPCQCSLRKKANLPKKLQEVYLKDFSLKFYPDIVINPQSSGKTYYEGAKKVKDAAAKFLKSMKKDKFEKGLFIRGNVGSGKTFLVACIFNELNNMGKDATFLVVPEFLDQAKEEMFNGSKGTGIIEKAKKTPILILDDLGAHNYTPWVINQIYNLLNYRLNNMLPTFVTTNLDYSGIEECLDSRISSRIFELFNKYNLSSDQDIRLKKSKV